MPTPDVEAPGQSFRGSLYKGSVFGIVNTANTTLALSTSKVAGTADSDAIDKNVLSLAGIVPMGPGDALYLAFAKTGTVTTPTFFLEFWKPILGQNGKVVGYSAFALCDVGSSLTYGSVAIGSGFSGTGSLAIAGPPGTAPLASLPAGTEVWASGITCNVGAAAVSTSTVLNNMDLIKTTDDGPCILRVTPMDGVSHVRVGQKTGGGGGTMWAFGWLGRGAALNTFNG